MGGRSPEVERFLGTTLAGQYRVDEVIGEGGMGVVYRARQLTVDRDVAIKIMRRELAKDHRATARFENEARVISKLRHPNTLRLYDCQRTDAGDLLIVTELLSGSPLAELLKEQGRLSVDRAVRIADQICRSLAEAHALGIVHRDLKPANVFIDRVGVDDLVKVLDFGIAKILEGNTGITRAGAVNGTPVYMSPEQARGMSVDPRSDIYSLGVMLFEMLTGVPPFRAKSAPEILRMHIHDPLPALGPVRGGAVPAPLESLLKSMLEKSPEARPPGVDEVLVELARIMRLTLEPRPLLETISDGPATERAPVPIPAGVPVVHDVATVETNISAPDQTRLVVEPVSLPSQPTRLLERPWWIAIAAAAMISAAVASWYVASTSEVIATRPIEPAPVPQPQPPAELPEPSPPQPVIEVPTATVAEPVKAEPAPPPQPFKKKKRKPRLGRDPVPVEIE